MAVYSERWESGHLRGPSGQPGGRHEEEAGIEADTESLIDGVASRCRARDSPGAIKCFPTPTARHGSSTRRHFRG